MENYTTTGKILPIGLLVCSHCKEKQLRGIDFTNSQVIGPTDFPVESTAASAVSICPVPDRRRTTVTPDGGGRAAGESNVIIRPVAGQQPQQSVKGMFLCVLVEYLNLSFKLHLVLSFTQRN